MAGAVALWAVAPPATAEACGGFFCSQKPVDQQAERIVFAVSESSTRMIVQIAYQGAAPDFAWVLPLAFVPDPDAIGTFPERAIAALDVNTSPLFWRPDDPECGSVLLNGGGSDANTPGVTVHIDEIVGPYEVVVVEGSDATELVSWLRDNGYRIGDAMIPYVELYAAEGMRLLALKLSPNAGVSDIEPLSLELPTTAPSIPIRLTAVAAEPEMGILVLILGDQRWGPSNWSEIEVDPATIRYEPHGPMGETSYLAQVSRAADSVDGMGWITEMAGPTAPLLESVRTAPVSDEDDERAREALVELLSAHPYLTRLYTRISPWEMRVDPAFRPHPGGDVLRDVRLSRFVDGEDMCAGDGMSVCDVAVCDPGTCTAVPTTGWPSEIPGCACPPDRTARTTVDPAGNATVVCDDPSRSLLDPGELAGGSTPLGDPCLAYDCGAGNCVPVSMTPTCRCSDGAVAVGWIERDGRRVTRCVEPSERVDLPRPPEAPLDAGSTPDAGMDAGRAVGVAGGGGCAASGVRSFDPAVVLVALALLAGRRRRR